MNTDTPETDRHCKGGSWSFDIDFARNLERQRNNTLVLLEREQMRLAACDVIAMCDTPASAAEARQMHSDYESAALDSVKRRVDECIALRQMVRELRDALALVVSWWDKVDRGTDEMEDSEVDTIAIQANAAITKANQLLP